jgi:uncharacterized protein YndB with AHSA1/START domain
MCRLNIDGRIRQERIRRASYGALMFSGIAGSVIGFVVVAVAALGLLGFRQGAGVNSGEVVITLPSSEVWRYMSDPQSVKRWVGGLVKLEPLAGTHLQVGARDRMVVQMGASRSELLSVVTSVEPGRRLAQRIVSGQGEWLRFEEDATFSLDDANGGTRLRVVARTRYSGFGRLLEPLVTVAAQQKLRADLARLKELVESDAE